MRHLVILTTLLITSLACAADNTIYLHNGKLKTEVPSTWRIIGHSPAGNRTVVAFQILGNKAEEGTADSTNLSIVTHYLKDTESMLAFIEPLSKKLKEGEVNSEYRGWALHEWKASQEKTKYRIIDARINHNELPIGIHVRLAWPLLNKSPEGYDEKMKKLLTQLLQSITKTNSDKQNKLPQEKR